MKTKNKKPTIRFIESKTKLSRSLIHKFLTDDSHDPQYSVVEELGMFFKIKNPTPFKIREKYKKMGCEI